MEITMQQNTSKQLLHIVYNTYNIKKTYVTFRFDLKVSIEII